MIIISGAVALALLASIVAYADNIYASYSGSGTIEKFDWSEGVSTFAAGMSGGPSGIAIQVPEPVTFLLLGLGGLALISKWGR